MKKHGIIVTVIENCICNYRLTPHLLWYFEFSFNYKALICHEYYSYNNCIYLMTLVPSISFLSYIYCL